MKLVRLVPFLGAALAACSSAPPPPPVDTAPLVAAPIASASSSARAAPPPPSAEIAVAPPRDGGAKRDDARLLGEGVHLALDDGAELVLETHWPASPDGTPALILALVRGGKVVARRDDFVAVMGVKAEVLTAVQICENARVSLAREGLGRASAVRASVICSMGEDYATATELATLFRLDGPLTNLDGLTRIWAGLAGTYSTAMDSCLVSHEVAFRLIDAKTLKKTITDEGRWVDQPMSDDVKARVKQACKLGTKKRVERVALP